MIKRLLEYAILAPSGHNSQPWKFKINKNILTILPDYTRIRTMVDPEKRELFISIGAVLTNLEIVGNYFEMESNYKIVDDKVVVEFEQKSDKIKDDKLFEAITKRRTYREEFADKKVDEKLIELLLSIDNENCWIEKVDDKQKVLLANLIWESDLIWFKSRDLMNELQDWMRDDVEENMDGLSSSMVNMYKMAAEIKYMFTKNKEKYKIKAKNNLELTLASPLMVLICSKNDNIENWVEAGKLYQYLALKLVKDGLTNGLFNSVIELNGQRKKIAKMSKTEGCVQMLLRIGYPKMEVMATPRRKLEEFLV